MVTSPLAGFLLGLLLMGLLMALISSMNKAGGWLGAHLAAALGQRVLRQGADRQRRLHGLRARHQRRAEDAWA
jgi:hypothetical protein